VISASFRGQRAHSGYILRGPGLPPCLVEAFGQALIDAFVEVAVGVEGRLDRGVTEAHLNHLRVGLLTDEHGRMRVPQIVTYTSVLELRHGKTRRQRRAGRSTPNPPGTTTRGRANGPMAPGRPPTQRVPFGSLVDQPPGDQPVERAGPRAVPGPAGAPRPGALQGADHRLYSLHVPWAEPTALRMRPAGPVGVGGPDASRRHARSLSLARRALAGTADQGDLHGLDAGGGESDSWPVAGP